MAAVGGGEGGGRRLLRLPQKGEPTWNCFIFKRCLLKISVAGEIQHSVEIGDRRRWRFHLSPRVGDCQGRYLLLIIFVKASDNNDHVQVRFIKAGTMEKLVESLASDTGELESTYINVFLATYRTFASPKQVLNLLTER